MIRFIALSFAVLATTLAAPALAQATTINVAGKLSNGAYVQVVCSVGANGQITGTGVLFGTNPGNGMAYKYPFVVVRGATTSGKLVLTGYFAGTTIPVTVSASVPDGPLTLSYIVNGVTYTLTGMGKVTVN
ncbi:MAG: hypothetical protein FJ143_16790 [Deltaproteobacteria bacterium]|nr:hypothetical protein [Deltaproteobacteria bacterium]